MAYITLKELKKILPGILDQWIDEDDESWEWIFQEIEQHCHVGKRKHIKGKKWKKKLRDDVDELQYFRHNEYEIKVNGIATRVNELNNKVSKLNDICNAHTVRLDNICRDITAAKSMAQIAKQRTEVDYSKYSGKSDGKINYCNPENKDCKSCKYYSDTEAIKSPCSVCEAYQYWEEKENEQT
jgi:outer membrane murein-binding lipoprotein Lpp